MRKSKIRSASFAALIESLEPRRLLTAVATETALSAPSALVLGQAFTVSVEVKTTSTLAPVAGGTVDLLNAGTATGLTAVTNSAGVATFTFGAGNAIYVGNYTLGATFVATATDAASSTAANTALAINGPSLTTESGDLGVASVTPGTGSGAVSGQQLTVQYTGFYESSGEEFDESAAHAPGSLTYVLDAPDSVIAGFAEGTTGMEAGETRVLVIPSALGYNDGQVRVFIVHCLSIGPSETDLGSDSKLAFNLLPAAAMSGSTLASPVIVNVEDASDNVVTTDSSNVTLSIASGPAGALLGGATTQAADGGVATFSDLSFSQSGTYTLLASVGGLSTTSTTITVAATKDATPTKAVASYGKVVNSTSPATYYKFSITFSDGSGVVLSSITGRPIYVSGPNPNTYFVYARPTSLSLDTNGSPIVGGYRIYPPATDWTSADNGVYTIWLRKNRVEDEDGNFTPGEALDTFTIDIPAAAKAADVRNPPTTQSPFSLAAIAPSKDDASDWLDDAGSLFA